MSSIYFVAYKVYYWKFFPVTKNADVTVNGGLLKMMQDVANIEDALSRQNKNRKVTIVNFILLMEMPQMKNPE